jgi:hypothetical protein
MNKQLSQYQWAYLQLLIMLIVIMAVSFLPETYPDFFGDWKCQGSELVKSDIRNKVVGCQYPDGFPHGAKWHWGFRHWMLLFFGVIFFFMSIARIVDGWERREP